MEAAVKALKMGKSAGVDNIPAELVQAGGEAMIDILTAICLNRLQPQAEEIIAEEQVGFRAGRSTTEQIFNLKGKMPAASAESLPCFHRLQEGL